MKFNFECHVRPLELGNLTQKITQRAMEIDTLMQQRKSSYICQG